jgi:3-methylfumaryl-CoA hydratase
VTDLIERTELLSTWPAEALAGLLGLPLPDLTDGLPLTWHWVYLLEHPRQEELGRDGHPATTGIPSPPGPGRRRMWAGGRVESVAPLRCGRPATRRTFVRESVDKIGRTGKLTFVTVAHEIIQDGVLAVSEEQDILYRDADTGLGSPPSGDAEVIAPGPHERPLEIDPVLLFRFSALTYNGHRIHYDRDYARDVEGYAGLVVHGPLQAMMMAEAARAEHAPHGPVRFEYRLVSPLTDQQGFVASAVDDGDGLATRVRDRSGRTTATGRFRSG